MSALLELGVLGPLEVRRKGNAIRLGAQKQRALLGLLLIRRSGIDRDLAIDALWGERPPKGARNTLQVYVSRLRDQLGREVIETTPAGYRLELPPGLVDAERFEVLFHDGRETLRDGNPPAALEALLEALSLWRGPAFADLRFEAFAQAEAGRLDELRLACNEERLDAELLLGRHAGLVGELEALVVEHPLRERLRGQLILALYRSGRQAEALAQYQATRRMLSDELGLEASPELRELERMILAHDPGLAAPREAVRSRSNLPLQPTPFIGREQELAELVGAVDAGSRRLVTLTGPGGSGKTRLAIEAASQLVEEFDGGVWWVPLQSLRDAALVLPAISEVVGTGFGDTRVLLVLDNFEQVLEAGVETAALLTQSAGLRLLVTSREPLHVAAEREYRVPPMTEPDAVALFDERAGQEADEEVVTKICRRLDFLPLAVELAAARTKVFTPQQILKRLDERLSFLARGPRDAPRRQQTLRATIDWSYDLLVDEEQRLLRGLSVFIGGCVYEASEAISDADPDTLESLLDKSLVVRRESEIGPRYWLLETIREFAQELTVSSAEQQALCRRHAEWFLARCEEAAAAMEGGDEPQWQPWEWYRTELPNIRAAFEWAFAQDETRLIQQFAAWSGLAWFATGAADEGRTLLTRALEEASPMPAREHARIVYGLGHLARVDDSEAKKALFAQALELFEDAGDTRGAFHSALFVAARSSDVDEARSRLEQVRATYPADSDWDRAWLLKTESFLEAAQLNWARALALADESRILFIRHGGPRALDTSLHNVAWFALNAGDLGRAKSVLHEYLADESVKNSGQIALAHRTLGLVAFYEEDRDAAASHFAQQLELLTGRPDLSVRTDDLAEDLIWGTYGGACVAAMDGDNARAVRLWGAANSAKAAMDVDEVSRPEQFLVDRYLEPARALLPDAAAESAWAHGAAMTLDEAAADALAALPRPELAEHVAQLASTENAAARRGP